MEWEFMLPVKLVFGNGKRKEIEKYIDILGGKNGIYNMFWIPLLRLGLQQGCVFGTIH